MKMAVSLAPPVISGPAPSRRWSTLTLRARISAYATLTKPRIALMVLITVAVGFVLGANGPVSPSRLFLTLLGTGLVAGGASAWNMILERDRDARMKRTANRPLPSGRVALGGAVDLRLDDQPARAWRSSGSASTGSPPAWRPRPSCSMSGSTRP